MDTIFAVSSGVGRSAIAVVRVSGPACSSTAWALCGRALSPRQATVLKVRDPRSGEVLDQALCLSFTGPSSFTGEDCLEFHLHGGQAVVRSVLRVLAEQPGLRPAEPGEFTRRAFQNEKLDLDSAEGLADLIEADTILQQRQALAALQGGFQDTVISWRQALLDCQAILEAWLEFPDESEISDALVTDGEQRLVQVKSALEAAIEAGRRAEIMRDGVKVLIAGPPNVGKSSLLNRLAQREAAIVSDIPGTTRDILEIRLDIDGIPVVVLDGAGIRATDDRIEQLGIERVAKAASEAQIIVWLSSSEAKPRNPPDWLTTTEAEVIEVTSKIDLMERPDAIHGISALTGVGVDRLVMELGTRASSLLNSSSAPVQLRQRHLSVVTEMAAMLEAGIVHLRNGLVELAVEECRAALICLSRVAKSTHSDDVLDSVFRRFCIGK